MDLAFPYSFDNQRRTAQAAGDDHIRHLIEQVLFTSPGERVNRPTFGTGLAQLVFAPSSGELATAVQFLVQGALQGALGDLIQVEGVQVDGGDATVTVTIQYVVLRTQQRLTAEFTRGGV
jgi:phage baseplate assembly protein W